MKNKSSAVAEMGDRLATIGMGESGEGLLWGLDPQRWVLDSETRTRVATRVAIFGTCDLLATCL